MSDADEFARFAFPLVRRLFPFLVHQQKMIDANRELFNMGRRNEPLNEDAADIISGLMQEKAVGSDMPCPVCKSDMRTGSYFDGYRCSKQSCIGTREGLTGRNITPPACYAGLADRGFDIVPNAVGTLGFDESSAKCLACPLEFDCSGARDKHTSTVPVTKTIHGDPLPSPQLVQRMATKRRQQRDENKAINRTMLGAARQHTTIFDLGTCSCGKSVADHLVEDMSTISPRCQFFRLCTGDMHPATRQAYEKDRHSGLGNVTTGHFSQTPWSEFTKAAVVVFHDHRLDRVRVLKNRYGATGGTFDCATLRTATLLQTKEVTAPANARKAWFESTESTMESRVALTNKLVKLLREFFIKDDHTTDNRKAELCELIAMYGPRSSEVMRRIGMLQRAGYTRPGLYRALHEVTEADAPRHKPTLDKDRDIEILRGSGANVNGRGEYSDFDLPDTFHTNFCKSCGHARGCMCPRTPSDNRFKPVKPKCRHNYVQVRTAVAQEMGFEIDGAVCTYPGEVFVCNKCYDDGFYDADGSVICKIKRLPRESSDAQDQD